MTSTYQPADESYATTDSRPGLHIAITLPELSDSPYSQSEDYESSSPKFSPESKTQSGPFDSELTLVNSQGHLDLAATFRARAVKEKQAKILPRHLGVLFKDLRVIGLGSTVTHISTVSSMLNPLSLIEAIQNVRHPPVRDIITGFEGVVRPGEMLLVLGRPGSGCTTFLKTLANQRGEFYRVDGTVQYDSITSEEIAKKYRSDVQYCPEDDVHFSSLTVQQTLAFAARMRTPRKRVESSCAEYINSITTLFTTILGLRRALNTCIGDASFRGVSGGEKRRVSIAEALIMRSRVNVWDNSTRGLDSSAALELGQALRVSTDVDRLTTIVSLYQASDALFRLFDKVCVIYEGRMAYFGPANQAKQYFIDMGYEPAPRQTNPDFLVSVTDPNGRIRRNDVSNIPSTAAEFDQYFRGSPYAELNKRDMENYERDFVGVEQLAKSYRESVAQEHARFSRKDSSYLNSVFLQFWALLIRRIQILSGNKLYIYMQLAFFTFEGLLAGSVFYHIRDSKSAYFSRGGGLYFTLIFIVFVAVIEIVPLFRQRPIISRHQNIGLYHPFAEGLALTVVDIVITGVCVVLSSAILYFLAGFQKSAGQFLVFCLFGFITCIVMKCLSRAVASMVMTEASAHAIGGALALALLTYTCYTVPKPSMVKALRWITHVNPLRYSFEALLANEFHTLNGTCVRRVPQGPGYENVHPANQACALLGAFPGRLRIDGERFIKVKYDFAYANTWMNFAILIAFGFAFLAVFLIFAEFNSALSKDTIVPRVKRGTRVATNSNPHAHDVEKGPDLSGAPAGLPLDENSENRERIKESRAANILTWHHLSYSIPVSNEQRLLLDDISGYVAPGKLTALMGESGAGKTTLLNVLAKRIDVGVITGNEYINGRALPADFQTKTGYCQQMDIHVASDTVREALLFSAKLRQPSSVPLAEKQAYVETCLKMCGLEEVADATVGSLSDVYRRRTSIGVELAAKPKLLLFLDEPTSGLDSQSAWAIVSSLRQLADSGQAILCTIHQPSSELFQAFDRLLLIRRGGQTIYFGDIGPQCTTLIGYFERNGSRKCQEDENPAEFMLDVIGAGATATAKIDWYGVWKSSAEQVNLQRELENIYSNHSGAAVEETFRSQYASSWLYQLSNLLSRNLRGYWREPKYIFAKISLYIVMGLFFGLTFFKPDNSQQGTQNKLFAIFMSTFLVAPLGNQLQLPFIKLRTIFEIRESSSYTYRRSALLVSQILAEVPWNILGATLYLLCQYTLVGLPSDRVGYAILMNNIIFPLYYTTLAQAVASVSPTPELANLAYCGCLSLIFVCCGVLQPVRLLGFWKWMYHLSPLTYIIGGLSAHILGGQPIRCSPKEFVSVNPPSGQTCGQFLGKFAAMTGGYLENTDAVDSCKFCLFSSSDVWLATNFDLSARHRWRDFGISCGFVAFNVAAMFALSYLAPGQGKGPLGRLKRRLMGQPH